MKIVIFKGEDGQWYWHIKASNGKIVCQSEGYKRKKSALNVVNMLKTKLAKANLVIEL